MIHFANLNYEAVYLTSSDIFPYVALVEESLDTPDVDGVNVPLCFFLCWRQQLLYQHVLLIKHKVCSLEKAQGVFPERLKPEHPF